MKFSKWLQNRMIAEGKKPQPVQMPKEKSNRISIEEPKQRIPVGRPNTQFNRKERRSGTRGSKERRSIGEY